MAEMKEFVLKCDRGPVVRFTGALLAHATENGDHWAIYQTKGKNWILGHRCQYRGIVVRDFKKPKMLVSYLQMVARAERSRKESPRDWSPRADYGVSEAIAKMIMDAGSEISQFLVRDVE